MNDDNPFATTPGFDALVKSAMEQAQRARSAPPAPVDPLAAARAAALKQFSGFTEGEREAVIARMRAARK